MAELIVDALTVVAMLALVLGIIAGLFDELR